MNTDAVLNFFSSVYDDAFQGMNPKKASEPPKLTLDKVKAELHGHIGVEEWLFLIFITFLIAAYMVKELRNQRYCQDNKREMVRVVDQKLTEQLAKFAPKRLLVKDAEIQVETAELEHKEEAVDEQDKEVEEFSTPKASPRLYTPRTLLQSKIPTIRRNFGNRSVTELDMKFTSSDAGDPGLSAVRRRPKSPSSINPPS